MLAIALSSPELVLKPEEAEMVAKNTAAVMRHYDLQASQKAIDIGNLTICLGAVYLPRIVAITARKTREKKNARAGFPPSVVTGASSTVPVQPPPGFPGKVMSNGNVKVQHPMAAGRPNGADPLKRPATPEDNSMLDELPPAMPVFN